uniref:Uncharacterized protein n=1 Tax=Anopheles albimanus TaxID=7167 RepID=A0A182FXE1_ANOAL
FPPSLRIHQLSSASIRDSIHTRPSSDQRTDRSIAERARCNRLSAYSLSWVLGVFRTRWSLKLNVFEIQFGCFL